MSRVAPLFIWLVPGLRWCGTSGDLSPCGIHARVAWVSSEHGRLGAGGHGDWLPMVPLPPYFSFVKFIIIYLAVLGLSRGIQTLSCSM